jgi:hypothetical protein
MEEYLMTESGKAKLEEGKKRLTDVEKRIGPYMPKIKTRSGVKRSEWRADNTAIRAQRSPKGKAK